MRGGLLRIVVSSVSLALLLLAPASVAATSRLPDLGIARLADIRVDKAPDGRKLLRYTTVVVNVGAGAFEVHGSRASTGESMAVSQRIYDEGGYQDVPTLAQMFFAGDGHSHWHVRDLESAELIRLDNGVKVGTWGKHGFCFFDNTNYRLSLPGAPSSSVYTNCGNSSSALAVTMGLSIGWGDTYPAYLPDQYIDVTGLAAGRYKLIVTADEQNWFTETNETNNAAWVVIQLKGNGNSVRIIEYGPEP